MRTLKKALCIVLALVMAVGLLTVAAGAKSLSDYSDANKVAEQYKVAVDVNTQLGVLKGRTDAAYDPQGTLNRAELATIIYRIVTGDVKDEFVKNYADAQRFEDVAPDQWFAGYVNYCADNGYLKGIGEGKYDPAGTLTGYQAMAALLRALGYDKLHEYEGADWYVAVTKDAKKINEGIVADWAKPISREIAAQLAFNTLEANPVMYVAILGDYVDEVAGMGLIRPLINTVFGVVREGIAFDEEGDPSYQYTKRNGAVVVDMPLAPVATYTTKFDICDMLVDSGIAKKDLGRYAFEWYENGAYDGSDILTHANLDCEDWPAIDGQGVLTRVYDLTDYNYDADYAIAQTYYYLAKVTEVAEDTHGYAGGITLEVYAGRGGYTVTGIADGEGYKKGDYVIVHPLFDYEDDWFGPFIGLATGESNEPFRAQIETWNVVIDQKAESFTDVRTKVTVDTNAKTVTYTVGGKEYNLDIDYFLTATGANVYKNVPYTWFFDLFGNLIGDIAVPAAATQYAVIDRIAYQANVLEDGFAPAKIVNMDASMEQINVTKLAGVPVYNGDYGFPSMAGVSQQWQQNVMQTVPLYVKDGTALTPVEDFAFDVDITKGIATIDLGFGDEIYMNKDTVLLYRTGSFGAYEYASYTGVTNAKTVKGVNIWFVANKNNYASVIFVDASTAEPQGSAGKFIVPEDLVPDYVVWVDNNNSIVDYYVYTLYDLDGNPVQIKATSNDLEGAPAGLYELQFDPAGYYNGYPNFSILANWYETNAPYTGTFVETGDTYEGCVYVDINKTGMNQYDFVDAKIIVVGENGIKTVAPEAAKALFTTPGNQVVVLASEYQAQAYSIVYVIL